MEYGSLILNEMSETPTFSRWCVELSSSGILSPVLDIGCGIGNNLQYLSELSDSVWGCDFNIEYIQLIQREKPNFGHNVFHWDLYNAIPPEYANEFNSFFCSNVIEHIENDSLALKNIYDIKSISCGVFIVPAIPLIYNQIDRNLDHFRRYSKKQLYETLTNVGFKVKDILFFNKIGILGWVTKGLLFRSGTLGRNNVKIFEKIMPLIKATDKYTPFWGLSLLAIVKN